MLRRRSALGRRPRDRWYLNGRTAILGGLASVSGLISGLNPFMEVTVLERLALLAAGVVGVLLLVASVNTIADR
jgi:hypothetical protein